MSNVLAIRMADNYRLCGSSSRTELKKLISERWLGLKKSRNVYPFRRIAIVTGGVYTISWHLCILYNSKNCLKE